jgi:hypothetical protein
MKRKRNIDYYINLLKDILAAEKDAINWQLFLITVPFIILFLYALYF